MSAQWPLDCENAISSPSAKIGRMKRTSQKCVPPRYGSLTANTSPGWMSSPNASMTALAVKCRVPTWTAMSCVPCVIGVALAVAERRREVARVEDERVAGAEDLLRHLVDDRDERVLQHLERDRVECGSLVRSGIVTSETWMRMFSHSSISAAAPGGTTRGGVDLLDDRRAGDRAPARERVALEDRRLDRLRRSCSNQHVAARVRRRASRAAPSCAGSRVRLRRRRRRRGR